MTAIRQSLRATYRLQLHSGFTFADAAGVIPYIARLGASHVYLSPILTARPGSSHGYDVVDHDRINPELGGAEGFEHLCETLRSHGLGIVLDIVPNHMGIGESSNRHWLHLLEWGRFSPAAEWFDVDWASPEPRYTSRIMVPFLGSGVAEALADGTITLALSAGDGAISAWIGNEHQLPFAPPLYGALLNGIEGLDHLASSFARLADGDIAAGSALKAELAEEIAGHPGLAAAITSRLEAVTADRSANGAMARLLDRQHWRLARYSAAAEALNYRRFFTVNDLAGIRIDRPEVFEAVHRIAFDLVARGAVDALRIDHVDGLADPGGYLAMLRENCPRPVPIFVEKILAPGETLPPTWPVAGTTGYEFGAMATSLLCDPGGEPLLSRAYSDFTGDTAPFSDLEAQAKAAIINDDMRAERDRLARRLHGLARMRGETADMTLPGLAEATAALITSMSVYRVYADGRGASPLDRSRMADAVAYARTLYPRIEARMLDFVARAALGDVPGSGGAGIAERFGQLAGPVMAKGLEDTALYRQARLIALNDVGSRPDRFHAGVSAFHAMNLAHAAFWPQTLLATSTHDSKRGEDARARIAVLSGLASEWATTANGWRQRLAQAGAPPIDDATLWYLFQSLVGAWPQEGGDVLPDLPDRVVDAMRKAVREARRHSSWTAPESAYEARLERLVRHMLEPRLDNRFLAGFRAFATRLAPLAHANSMLLTVLKFTVPGVPDIYQGSEGGEQSLVDPDNRRSVDFASLAETVESGAQTPKLALVRHLLAVRSRHPQLFAEGSYIPLAVAPPHAERVVAFARQWGSEALVVMAGLWPWRGDIEDVSVDLPGDLAGQRWQRIAGSRDAAAETIKLPAAAPYLVLLASPD